MGYISAVSLDVTSPDVPALDEAVTVGGVSPYVALTGMDRASWAIDVVAPEGTGLRDVAVGAHWALKETGYPVDPPYLHPVERAMVIPLAGGRLKVRRNMRGAYELAVHGESQALVVNPGGTVRALCAALMLAGNGVLGMPLDVPCPVAIEWRSATLFVDTAALGPEWNPADGLYALTPKNAQFVADPRSRQFTGLYYGPLSAYDKSLEASSNPAKAYVLSLYEARGVAAGDHPVRRLEVDLGPGDLRAANSWPPELGGLYRGKVVRVLHGATGYPEGSPGLDRVLAFPMWSAAMSAAFPDLAVPGARPTAIPPGEWAEASAEGMLAYAIPFLAGSYGLTPGDGMATVMNVMEVLRMKRPDIYEQIDTRHQIALGNAGVPIRMVPPAGREPPGEAVAEPVAVAAFPLP